MQVKNRLEKLEVGAYADYVTPNWWTKIQEIREVRPDRALVVLLHDYGARYLAQMEKREDGWAVYIEAIYDGSPNDNQRQAVLWPEE